MDKIDFVVTWVDGNDPIWQAEKNKYSPAALADTRNSRYRDMGILRYWFRAIEKYAPWVNKVHFVTYGHLPEWLNINCEKLNIVNHSDYISEEYLPTFSSRTIEINMHKIKGLSEKFVYFNDDVFLNAPIDKEFFFKNNKPCDFLYLNHIGFESINDVYALARISCTRTVNNDFTYIKSFFKNPFKYINIKYSLKNNLINILSLCNNGVFVGFDEHHLAFPYLKSTFETVWDKHEDILQFTNENKFRAPFTVNHYIFRYYQLASGNFTPVSKKSRGRNMSLILDTSEIIKEIESDNYKVICINDSDDTNFDNKKKSLIDAFEKKFPRKSIFEI